MEQQEINVYEAIPLLKEVLNQSGFSKLIGKSSNWLHEKSIQRSPLERMVPGFTEDNVELINYGLEKVAEACDKHILHLPSLCQERDIYNKYVKTELKDLRKLVSFVYLRENYTNITKSTFDKKLINAANRGAVAQFTEEDIKQINFGIEKTSQLLRSLKITL